MVDASFSSPRGVECLHRQAVAGAAAIAAAFTDAMVDDDAVGWSDSTSAFAIAPELGGTRLIVDEHGDARGCSEYFLCFDEARAMPYVNLGWPVVMPVGVVGGDDDTSDSLAEKIGGNSGGRQLTRWRLATGHRYRPVVEQLECHVASRRDGGGDGELPAVEVRTVTDVLDHVIGGNEVFHSDPERSFVAHCGNTNNVAAPAWFAEHDHRVASNSCSHYRPLRNHR